MYRTGWRNGIQYVYITCLMIREPLYGFPTSDIEYPIELDRWTASDKLYITQLLHTRYPINITNALSGYQYNKQWIYVYEVDFLLNIHLMYVGIRWISDQIFNWCMNSSIFVCRMKQHFVWTFVIYCYWWQIQENKYLINYNKEDAGTLTKNWPRKAHPFGLFHTS
jgi:hypothetical protein